MTTPADSAPAAPARHLGPETTAVKQTLVLRSAEFRKGREFSWRELESMVNRIEKSGINTLSAEEVQQMPLLYRTLMSSLSVARNIVLDRNLLLYLESLALRAYLVVYGPRTGIFNSIRVFFTKGFPQAVRDIRWHLAVVFVVMAAAAIAGYLLVRTDINYYNMIIPEYVASGRGPSSSTQELRDILFSPFPGILETFVFFATYLFQHNSMVGIFSFGLGFALGIPTVLLIAYNGVVLGAFVGLHAEKDLLVECLGWLSIHGVTELFAIMLCGAAGLVVAQKIIFPGNMTRLESLAVHGRKAAAVVVGAVALLFCAGILEGGFRQLINVTWGRFVVAALTAAFWLFYFTSVGKVKQDGDSH